MLQILFVVDVASAADRALRVRAARPAWTLAIVETAAACRAHLAAQACDLLVLDRDLDGIALLAQLRHDGHVIPAIVVTAPDDETAALRALEAGAIDFVPRTADVETALVVRLAAARVRAQQESLSQRIVQSTGEGIWVIDANAATTFVNPQMARMLGYTVDEMSGRSLFDFMDEVGRAIATRNLARRRDGVAEGHEFVFKRKDGTDLHALLATNPIVEAGVYAGALALVHDIGDRVRAEQVLVATEERFRQLFEHSPNCLWEEDGTELKRALDALVAGGVADVGAYLRARPDEVIRLFSLIEVIDVNQAAVHHYGARDKAELLAGLARTLVPESVPVLVEQLVALASGATVFEAETIDQTFDGRQNHILLKTLLAPGSETTFSKVYVSMVDITARKHAEDRVRKLASFPELNPNAVLELSDDGAIAYANPAALAMASAIGAGLAQLLPRETLDIVREALATSRPHQIETRHGSHTVAWSFHPVAPGKTVHCYATDITERLHLEDRLRQSQKMDAIGHLAGGVAHDFNNLLTVIQGNTVLLQRGRSTPERTAEAFDYIESATTRAATLVRQLLAFSRQQLLQPRELDLNVAVGSLVKMLERVVRKDIELQLQLAPEPMYARADAGMLDQVVMNLVVNARDAMPDGGSILLETSVIEIADVEALGLPPGRYVCLRVTDTGEGIAAEHLPKIFEPFFTTKELGKGTGLGLATAFGIIKQHDGSISVTSEVGRGTTFTVLLPMASHAPSVAASVASKEPEGGAETILVVEDEEPVRHLVQHVLELKGYRVMVVSTGADALALAREAEFDLVLTDIVMPGGVSGRDLAERLRANQPGLKVIYMSGYASEVASRGLELREGDNFLQKPFGPIPLLACVRGCLDRG